MKISNFSKNFIAIYRDNSVNDLILSQDSLIRNSLIDFISRSSLKIVNNNNRILDNIRFLDSIISESDIRKVNFNKSLGIGDNEDIYSDKNKVNLLSKIEENKKLILDVLEIDKKQENSQKNNSENIDIIISSIKSIMSAKNIDILNIFQNVQLQNRNKIYREILKANLVVTKAKYIFHLLDNIEKFLIIDNLNKDEKFQADYAFDRRAYLSEMFISLLDSNHKQGFQEKMKIHKDNFLQYDTNLPFLTVINIIVEDIKDSLQSIYGSKSPSIKKQLEEIENISIEDIRPLEICYYTGKNPEKELDINLKFVRNSRDINDLTKSINKINKYIPTNMSTYNSENIYTLSNKISEEGYDTILNNEEINYLINNTDSSEEKEDKNKKETISTEDTSTGINHTEELPVEDVEMAA